MTEALFNENNKSAYQQEEVQMTNYDALDRVTQITDSLLQNTNELSYDSLDSVLSTSDSANAANSVSYTYDPNGRRIIMTPASAAAISYGYDCADELVGISNNGTWTPPSCSPSTSVNYTGNISTSAQVAFNLDADGNPAATLVDGVETVITRDADERVTSQTFGAYASPAPTPSYGGLAYQYNGDSEVTDKGGSLAAVNIPSAVSTTSYSATDQVTNWNGTITSPDHASNITTDPASGTTLTWNARNQVANITSGGVGFPETYDGLGRRETLAGGQSFQYDGSTLIGWTEGGATYNFLTAPGGGALAGSFTPNGTTTTWVPLTDASGSTIGLVNAASTGSLAATYTYDPFGTPTLSGATTFWPFLHHGMEQEALDPPYYYSGGGQFYSPQLVRSLSEVGQTSSQGSGGPSPNQVPYGPGSQGNGSFGHWYVDNVLNQPNLEGVPDVPLPIGEVTYEIPVFQIAQDIEELVSFFEWLFGGSGAPPTPRQLLRGRHPLYPDILGVQHGLIPDEVSAAYDLYASQPGISMPSSVPALNFVPPGTPPTLVVGSAVAAFPAVGVDAVGAELLNPYVLAATAAIGAIYCASNATCRNEVRCAGGLVGDYGTCVGCGLVPGADTLRTVSCFRRANINYRACRKGWPRRFEPVYPAK